MKRAQKIISIALAVSLVAQSIIAFAGEAENREVLEISISDSDFNVPDENQDIGDMGFPNEYVNDESELGVINEEDFAEDVLGTNDTDVTENESELVTEDEVDENALESINEGDEDEADDVIEVDSDLKEVDGGENENVGLAEGVNVEEIPVSEDDADLAQAENAAEITLSEVIDSGETGDCKWAYYEDEGLLVISGEGAMGNYVYTNVPWYEYRENIKTVEIPDGITSIGDSAFANCNSLTSIDIPDSVTIIGNHAFSECSSLKSIEIPNGITSIEDSAFAFCSSLTSIEIPDSVTSIGNRAFSECSSLTSIEIPNGVTSIGDGAFSWCSSLTSIDIPDGVITIGESAFNACSNLIRIKISNSVTSIGESTFSYCSSLRKILIPSSVTSIGDSVFYNRRDDLIIYGQEDSYAQVYANENNIEFNDISIWDNDATAFGKTGECKWAYYEEDSLLVISGEGAMGDYSMQPPWTNYGEENFKTVKIGSGVTSIGNRAFYGCDSLISIEIPDSVTSIGNGAFYYCHSLTSIEIPDSVTSIGEGAFYYCFELASLNIPSSVTSIGDYMFFACVSLIDINIPNSVTSIGNSSFMGCNSLTSIEIPDSIISIGDDVFRDCSSLTSIEIPDSVTSIGERAFVDCSNLASIKFSESVTSIGDYAFFNCINLTNIIVDENNINYSALDGVLFDKDKTVLIQYPAGKADKSYMVPDTATSIGDAAFQNCSNLTSIAIPDSTTSIGIDAFSDCSNLTSIEIPDSVISIGWFAFENCSSLTSINIPNSVTSIGWSAFSGCNSLTSVKIPDNVISIEEYTFFDCSSLTSLKIPANVTSIGDGAFAHCSDELIIYGQEDSYAQTYANENGIEFKDISSWDDATDSGKTGDCKWAYYEDEGLLVISGEGAMGDYEYGFATPWYKHRWGIKTVEIDGGVTSIGDYAFYECDNLTSINIPDSVTSVGDYAFWECLSLTSIIVGENNANYSTLDGVLFNKDKTILIHYPARKADETYIIPDSVTSIWEVAFYYCWSLTSIDIPDSVTNIGDSAFEGCINLTSIELPDSLISIGGAAFYNSNLTSIRIPAKVTSIGNDPFFFSNNLTSIIVDENNANYSDLDGVLFDKDKTVLIHYPAGKADETYTIPNSVTSIGRSAFQDGAFVGCSSLTSIDIPASVTNIGQFTFYGCRSLASIDIPANVTSIGRSAFSDCYSLTSIKIPDSVTSIGDHAFSNSSDELTIYGKKGSEAYKYALNERIRFLDERILALPEPSDKKGVLDKDREEPEIRDALILLETINNGLTYEDLPENYAKAYDVGDDGAVTIHDVLLIINMLLGEK